MDQPIPIILDTDIGTDIDDTWALALALKSPELNLKLVTAATGRAAERARIAARLLDVASRADVPVGVGLITNDHPLRHAAWVERYRLTDYPGTIHEDGVGALVETIMRQPPDDPITLVAIGPLPNVAAALLREPGIAARARFVGMHGSIRRNLDGAPGAIAEYNVQQDIAACRAVFEAPWMEKIITPLDTCAQVRLQGPLYQKVVACPDALARAVIENYRIWAGASGDAATRSSILFDTVAVHLAHTTRWLRLESLRLNVNDSGFTLPARDGAEWQVALDWVDNTAYHSDLAARLCGAVVRTP